MTEDKRYEIDRDLIYDMECVWDKDSLIGEIDDKDTVFRLVDILNMKEFIIQELIDEKECLATFIMQLGYTIISNEKGVIKITKENPKDD